MIVRFTTGTHFSPSVQSQTEIFRNRSQMRKGKPIFTGLEPLDLSVRNTACMLKEQGAKEVDIEFCGYLPEYSRSLVTAPFRRRRIDVKYSQG